MHFIDSCDNKKIGIYEIYNSYKNRFYIGQTVRSFAKRYSDYIYNIQKLIEDNKYKTNINSRLKNDFLKCYNELGRDNFLTFKILEIVEDENKLDEREIFYISDYRNKFGKDNVYNFLNGGHCMTENIRNKISSSNKGKRLSQNTEFKSGQNFEEKFGEEKAKEIKEKIRNSRIGRSLSDETKQKIADIRKENNYLKGKTFQEVFGEEKALEMKQRISETSKGRKSSFLGKTHTQESRAKISKSKTGKFTGLSSLSAKIYDLTDNPLLSPDGKIFSKIECLKLFCREHGLTPSALCWVLKGKLKTHKGWKLMDSIKHI
jgi:hypothetical protein